MESAAQTQSSPTPENSDETPWVLCKLATNLFGISASLVESMVLLPDVIHVPETPDYIRGVVNLRGQVLRVVDLRGRLGFARLNEEAGAFVDMLEKRESEHRSWIAELDKSVEEKRPFKLQTDPTRCHFGRWFYSFQTDDVVLQSIIRRFENPHIAIHGIAKEVEAAKAAGDFQLARDIIQQTREGALSKMIALFEETKNTFLRSQREIALVIRNEAGKASAVVVDQVVSVEPLRAVDAATGANAMQGIGRSELLKHVAFRQKDDGLVFLLAGAQLVD